jgi:hypothetical protein
MYHATHFDGSEGIVMTDDKAKTRELRESVAEAKTTAARLSKATDAMNAALVAAEAVISGFNLGVTASVTITDEGDGWYQSLRFAKDGKDWRLMVETGNWNDPDDDPSVTPIATATRAIRRSALKLIPDLLDALVKEAAKQAKDIEADAAEAEEFLKAVKGS